MSLNDSVESNDVREATEDSILNNNVSLSKLNLSEIEHPVNKTRESYSSIANHSGFSLNVSQSSVPMQENTCACEEESIIAVEDDDDEEKSTLQKDMGDEETLSYSKSLAQMNGQNANINLKQNNKKRIDKCREQNGKNIENDFSVTQNSNDNTHPIDESTHKSISISTNVGKKEKANENKTVEILPANKDVHMQNEDKVSDVEATSITVNGNGGMQAKEFCYGSEIIANVCEDIDMQNNDLLFQEDPALFQHSLLELGRRLWTSTAQEQRYTKGCLWSPDGTCLLLPVNLDGMHILELPQDLYNTAQLDSKRPLSSLPSAIHIKEGGTVYDCVWYPFMDSSDPATCCWLASRQHEPIHMWDAFTGELRCTYRGYDEVDEVEPAISLLFSNDGQKVMGGYKKSIKIFDTNIPGRKCSSITVKQTVSCFAVTAENNHCVSTGSWNAHIYHYDLRAPKLGPLFTLGGHTGGITWLRYFLINGNWYLFSGARKDSNIFQWDMRNYKQPVSVFERNVSTNQRIYFDLKREWLVSGNTTGSLTIWSLEDSAKTAQLPIHADCCNGANFHPSLPILATSSGQYHFVDVTHDEKETKQVKETEKFVDYENSVVLLWVGNVPPPK
uniref:WD repeat-containing protein 79 n=1 Tax=Glossina pallidipes TaxID=7398 RepID=A0A1B0AAL4_GLOPL